MHLSGQLIKKTKEQLFISYFHVQTNTLIYRPKYTPKTLFYK